MREYTRLGLLLKDCRVESGLTQTEVAKKLSVHSQFVSNWERGLCAPPNHVFQKLIALLRVDRNKMVDAMLEDSKAEIEAKIFNKKKKRA